MSNTTTQTVLIYHTKANKLIREGTPVALSALYDQFACSIYGVICKIVGNKKEAEEVLKQTFTIAWNNRSGFDESKQSCHHWLINIARDLALKKSSVKPVSQNQKTVSFVDDNQLIKEIKTELSQYGLEMNEEQRKVLELVFFKGIRINEVAIIMGTEVHEAKQLLRDAVNCYRKELQKS